MVRGQRGKVAIHPVLEERSVGLFEVEADREVIRRDVCQANQLKASCAIRKAGPEPGVEPELPGVVHVAGIVGRSIRPHQAWSHTERPGCSVGTDAAILQAGNFACRARMDHALRIPVEERQVQRIILHPPAPITPLWNAIGNERIWVMSLGSPGASVHRDDSRWTASWA